MRHKQSNGVETDSVERQFYDAIDRIIKLKPKHPDLAKKVELGTFKPTISAISLEAGFNRTLIGHKNCQYPQIREKALSIIRKPVDAQKMTDTIKNLRNEKSILEEKLKLLASENMALIARMYDTEKHLKIELERNKMLIKKQKHDNHQVVGLRPIKPEENSENIKL